MRFLFWCFCVFLSAYGYAASNMPPNCESMVVEGETLLVKGKHTKLVYIHNITASDLWITHPAAEAGANAGWSSRLKSENWSVLMLNSFPFSLNCTESKPGHEQQIPCKGAIDLCIQKKVPKAKQHSGNFWVGEDISLETATVAVSKL